MNIRTCPLCSTKDGDCILSEALNEYGKDGWEVYQIITNPMGMIVFLKRTNTHTD